MRHSGRCFSVVEDTNDELKTSCFWLAASRRILLYSWKSFRLSPPPLSMTKHLRSALLLITLGKSIPKH